MADNEKENSEEEVNENGGRADAFKPLTSNDAGTDYDAVQYFDEDDPNGEYRDAQTDLLEDRNAMKRAQDRQFIEGGAKRTGDPLATSTGDLEGNYRQSIADASKGGTVVGTGTRLADDRSWEARYNAMQERKRAERAGLRAQSQARQELLDTGRYFDDGRGNIKLKKSERQKVRRDSTRRGWHMDTEADNGAGMRYIQRAGNDAYNGSMNGWQQAADEQETGRAKRSFAKTSDSIASVKAEAERMKQEKAESVKRNANAMLGIYDGATAVYTMLNDDGASEDLSDNPMINFTDDFKYNKKTRQKEPTGFKRKNAILPDSAVKTINSNLRANGNNNFTVTQILASKLYDKSGLEYGEPTITVFGKMVDRDGKIHYTQRDMTVKDLYRIGVQRGEESGLKADLAEQNVISVLGDLYGRNKAAESKNRGWSPERIELEDKRLRLREEEEKGRNARAGSKNDAANARLAASVAKYMTDIKRGLRLDDKRATQLQDSLTKILTDAFNPQQGGGGEHGIVPGDKAGMKSPDNSGREIKRDENGVEWEIVRDENGKPIGKRRVSR